MALFYISYFLILIYVVSISFRAYHMLQQNLYNENNRYLKWVWKNKKTTLKNLNLYGILFATFILISNNVTLNQIFMIILMSVYVVSYFRTISHNQKS